MDPDQTYSSRFHLCSYRQSGGLHKFAIHSAFIRVRSLVPKDSHFNRRITAAVHVYLACQGDRHSDVILLQPALIGTT